MTALETHPTVVRARAAQKELGETTPQHRLDSAWLRAIALDAGADDVGFVSIDRPELDDQRADILAAFPRTRTLVSLVRRMNRDNIRTPARSIANVEFHHTVDAMDGAAVEIVRALEAQGIRAMDGAAVGFPMEMDRFPGKTWVISHKPVAVAAGLGRMGIHRNVIHPRFGNFILLGTVLVDALVTEESRPIDYNPCLECKLCVAACPTGAIHPDGYFDFSACLTHNYREFLGGFGDFVETIAESSSAADYRSRVSDAETASMWQSLSFGANYKAAYCMAVCPAGEDVIGPFLGDRKAFLADVVKPLQEKEEIVYVVAESDAERHVAKRFPRKRVRRVHNGVRPATIPTFLRGMQLTFQRDASAGLTATYHFTFTGESSERATVIIADRTLQVLDGHVGAPSLRVKVDARTWLRIVGRETKVPWAIVRGKLRISGGSPRLLLAFARCFPS